MDTPVNRENWFLKSTNGSHSVPDNPLLLEKVRRFIDKNQKRKGRSIRSYPTTRPMYVDDPIRHATNMILLYVLPLLIERGDAAVIDHHSATD